jgi:ribosomal protein S24E
MLKNSRKPLSDKLQKMCGQKQENMIVVKIEKEYCKENGIDRSVIEPGFSVGL